MRVKQLSIFLENKAGRLAAVTQTLGEKGFNIRALSLADTADFGILRLIVTQPMEAYAALKEAGFTSSLTDVIAVEVPDDPGGLARVMRLLGEGGVNIEYLYAFCEKRQDSALVIFRVEDIDTACRVLGEHGVQVIPSEDVYHI